MPTTDQPTKTRWIIDGYGLHLEDAGKASRTVTTYLDVVARLSAVHDPCTVTAAQAAVYLRELRSNHAPATTQLHHVVLRQFFRWLVVEGDRQDNPLDGRPLPRVQAQPVAVAVVSQNELRRLLLACSSASFEDRRDTAIIRLLLDTGMRRAELAGLRVEDVDLTNRVVTVTGKGTTSGRFPMVRGQPRPCLATYVSAVVATTSTPRLSGSVPVAAARARSATQAWATC